MAHDPREIDAQREQLQDSTNRLVRTVDGFTDDDFAAPSLLPGWSRAHLVAHLALNSEGLAGAVQGLLQGAPTSMYASQEARERDIDELSGAEPAELRARLLGGAAELAEALAAVPDDAWDTPLERTPGGRTFRARAVPGMRLREVEIHHVDLGAGYHRREWPTSFSALVLESMAKRAASETPFTAAPTDLSTTYQYGDDGPTVSGTAADLAWWLTGRGDGEGLTSDSGELPRIEEW